MPFTESIALTLQSQLTCLLPQGVPSAMGAVRLKQEYPSNVHHRLPQSVCNQIVRATSRNLKDQLDEVKRFALVE